MIRMIRPIAVLLGTVCMATPATAQSLCTDYHKFNCQPSPDKRFSVNGQSKSAAVQVGKPTVLNIIAYRGQDYRISVCPDPRYLGDALAIRLIERVREPVEVEETVTTQEPIIGSDGQPTGATQEVRTKQKKRVFEEVDKVLWDNTEHDMAQEIEFSCTATKRIAVEVSAAGVVSDKPKRSDKEYDIGCVGILIEHMTTPVIGFSPQH